MPQDKAKNSNRISELPQFLQVLLFILTLGLVYWLKTRQDEAEKRANIQNLIPNIHTALQDLEKAQSLLLYFSNYTEKKLSTAHSPLLKAIPRDYQNCGLSIVETQTITTFLDTHKNIKQIRSFYNQRFIQHETEDYREFFSKLDKHPLSEEQMRAVICEEDNNLVIAGAGTGKTTTISAKVAYILEKNLARPEELLVISFTNTAVEEMFERTCSFLKDHELASRITFRTFNSFGNMVLRHSVAPVPGASPLTARITAPSSFFKRPSTGFSLRRATLPRRPSTFSPSSPARKGTNSVSRPRTNTSSTRLPFATSALTAPTAKARKKS